MDRSFRDRSPMWVQMEDAWRVPDHTIPLSVALLVTFFGLAFALGAAIVALPFLVVGFVLLGALRWATALLAATGRSLGAIGLRRFDRAHHIQHRTESAARVDVGRRPASGGAKS